MVKGRGDDPNQHDILTGTQRDGTAFPAGEDRTCSNWTSSGEGAAMVGHHDLIGNPQGINFWNFSHPSRGCSQESPHRHRRQRLFLLLREQLRRERTLPSRGKPGRQLQRSRGARGDSLARPFVLSRRYSAGRVAQPSCPPDIAEENRTPS